MDLRAGGLVPQRLDDPALGEGRRRDAGGGLGEHRLGGVDLLEDVAEPVPGGVELSRADLVLGEPEREAQRHQVVLGAVVQVALEGAALAVHLGHRGPPGGRDLLPVRHRRAQLALELDLDPVRLEHGAEAVRDVREQLPALAAARDRLAVDGQHADLVLAVPDREDDRRVGLAGVLAPPPEHPVAQAGAVRGQLDGPRAEVPADRLGQAVELGARRGGAGELGDLEQDAVRGRAAAVQQAFDEPVGPRRHREVDQRADDRAHHPRERAAARDREDQRDGPADRDHHDDRGQRAVQPVGGRAHPRAVGGQDGERERRRREPGEPEQQGRRCAAAPVVARRRVVEREPGLAEQGHDDGDQGEHGGRRQHAGEHGDQQPRLVAPLGTRAGAQVARHPQRADQRHPEPEEHHAAHRVREERGAHARDEQRDPRERDQQALPAADGRHAGREQQQRADVGRARDAVQQDLVQLADLEPGAAPDDERRGVRLEVERTRRPDHGEDQQADGPGAPAAPPEHDGDDEVHRAREVVQHRLPDRLAELARRDDPARPGVARARGGADRVAHGGHVGGERHQRPEGEPDERQRGAGDQGHPPRRHRPPGGGSGLAAGVVGGRGGRRREGPGHATPPPRSGSAPRRLLPGVQDDRPQPVRQPRPELEAPAVVDEVQRAAERGEAVDVVGEGRAQLVGVVGVVVGHPDLDDVAVPVEVHLQRRAPAPRREQRDRRRGGVVQPGLDLPREPLGQPPGEVHRPRQVGDHLLQRRARALLAQDGGVDAAGDDPEAVDQLRQPFAGLLDVVARHLGGFLVLGVLQRLGGVGDRLPERREPVGRRALQLGDQAPALDLARDLQPAARRGGLGGELVDAADPGGELGAPRDALQHQVGAARDVAHQAPVAGGDRSPGLADGQHRPQALAVEHRDRVVDARAGQQRAQRGDALARPVRRERRLGDQDVADHQPHDRPLGGRALAQHAGEARQGVGQRALPDAGGGVGEHGVGRGRRARAEAPGDAVRPGPGRPRRRHGERRGDERADDGGERRARRAAPRAPRRPPARPRRRRRAAPAARVVRPCAR